MAELAREFTYVIVDHKTNLKNGGDVAEFEIIKLVLNFFKTQFNIAKNTKNDNEKIPQIFEKLFT